MDSCRKGERDDLLTDHQDAYGHEVMDYYRSGHAQEIVERDDGLIDVSAGPAIYFSGYKDWRPLEQQAMLHVRGRVLDIGCGAGRFALYLQEQGHPVVGIDTSPLALQVCQERGVKDVRLLSITQISRALGTFDSIIMMGNNFGLFGGPRRGRWLLRRMYAITSPEARIIAQSTDPHDTDDPIHLAYQANNRARGRADAQLRIRIRYRTHCSPWFDYWLATPTEAETMVAGSGWRIEHLEKDASDGAAVPACASQGVLPDVARITRG